MKEKLFIKPKNGIHYVQRDEVPEIRDF